MTCERFDTEGAALLLQGAPLGPHYDTCPDCLKALRAQRLIVDSLAAWASEERVPAGWEQRLRAALAREQEAEVRATMVAGPAAAPARRRAWPAWRWASVGTLAAAAAAAVWVWLPPGPDGPTPGTPRLSIVLAEGGPLRRAQGAQVGQRLRLEGETGGRRVAEIRVYRGREPQPVLACSERPPCRRDGERLTVEWTLVDYGEYQALLLASSAPLPAPGRGLDEDTAAAQEAGAEVVLLQANAFEVR